MMILGQFDESSNEYEPLSSRHLMQDLDHMEGGVTVGNDISEPTIDDSSEAPDTTSSFDKDHAESQAKDGLRRRNKKVMTVDEESSDEGLPDDYVSDGKKTKVTTKNGSSSTKEKPVQSNKTGSLLSPILDVTYSEDDAESIGSNPDGFKCGHQTNGLSVSMDHNNGSSSVSDDTDMDYENGYCSSPHPYRHRRSTDTSDTSGICTTNEDIDSDMVPDSNPSSFKESRLPRLPLFRVDDDDEDDETDIPLPSRRQNRSREEVMDCVSEEEEETDETQISYSRLMRERIGQLPIPQALKSFLNYNRN